MAQSKQVEVIKEYIREMVERNRLIQKEDCKDQPVVATVYALAISQLESVLDFIECVDDEGWAHKTKEDRERYEEHHRVTLY